MAKYIIKGTRVFDDKSTDYIILESEWSGGDNVVKVFDNLEELLSIFENYYIHKDDYQRYRKNIVSFTNKRPYDAWDYPKPDNCLQYYNYLTIYKIQD